MITLPHNCRERAYRNILRTTISTLWRMDLLNQAPLHLSNTDCMKASDIHIARDDLQRRDLFKPAHYLRSHLDQLPLLLLEPKPPPTSHSTSTLPMTTHTPPTTSSIAPLASPSRSGVMNPTPSYTVPTLPPSPTVSSSALPALFVDMISAPGPHTPHSNKLQFSLGPAPLNSSANTTKHGLTLPPLHAHNSSTHSNLTFPNTNHHPLPGPYHPSSPPLPAPPLMIYSARCVKVPVTRKKCFSVTYVTPVGIWTASSPLSPPSLLGYGNVPCAPFLSTHTRVNYDTSASPPPY